MAAGVTGPDVSTRHLRARPAETGSDSPAHDAPVPVVISATAAFEGLLTFRGDVRVDGEVRGEILCHGTLWLGVSSVVRAVVEGDELIIAGDFEGEASARRRIELLPTARVRGMIRAPLVALAEGCVLDGQCQTRSLDEVSEGSLDEASGSA